jgi:hypothetical protein
MARRTDSLTESVAHYIAEVAPRRRTAARFYESQSTLVDVIRVAARAEDARGKRLSHQRRIPRSSRLSLEAGLLRQRRRIKKASSFEALHEVVAEVAKSIRSIGPLTVYDTALRVGAWLRLEPAVVFLHAGTRIGARRLGLDVSSGTLSPKALPPAFDALRPDEVEDVLCIYKDVFGHTMGARRRRDCLPPAALCA